MPGGPSSSALIRSYRNHIAPRIWMATQQEAGAPVDALDPPLVVRGDPMRRILRTFVCLPHFEGLHPFRTDEDGSWWSLAQRSSVTRLAESEHRRMDIVLLSAFVERWHPETNSFHFPWGEITITLHDVVHIMGLQIDSAVVVDIMPHREMYEALASILGVD